MHVDRRPERLEREPVVHLDVNLGNRLARRRRGRQSRRLGRGGGGRRDRRWVWVLDDGFRDGLDGDDFVGDGFRLCRDQRQAQELSR